MKRFPLLAMLCLMFGLSFAAGVESEPPEEVLRNLEFFLDYDLVENLDFIDSEEFDAASSTDSVTSPIVEISTEIPGYEVDDEDVPVSSHSIVPETEEIW